MSNRILRSQKFGGHGYLRFRFTQLGGSRGLNFRCCWIWQVGDSNEKLAEGIKMLAVSIPPSAKRTVLSDLITVSSLGCVLGLNYTAV
jgi:hypothetical protein